MESENPYSYYISRFLISEITKKLQPNITVDHVVKHEGGLDGFMSTLYSITVKFIDLNTKKTCTKEFIAKFMKGDDNFRTCSRSFIQFANEISIHSKVLPYFSEILKKYDINALNVEDWVPKVYVAQYGRINWLSDRLKTSNESVLVMENLKPQGYTPGPRLYLNKDHLLAMVKPLAEYHAMSYALRIMKDPVLEQLESAIIPLPFVGATDSKTNLYEALYRVAFDRFFDYFERSKDSLFRSENADDSKLEKSILALREKYGKDPTRLLEFIRLMGNGGDATFSAILHGDFNRNNVMFRYSGADVDAKLIDFQEVRVGSPCIDLSFAMYMNLDRSIRDEEWMPILKFYNQSVHTTLQTVIQKSNPNLLPLIEQYTFPAFYEHFKKYAFYGVMVCMHFLPWLVGTEDELRQLAAEFERDMHGEAFRKISFTAGGDDANQRLFEIVKHACKLGYLEYILEN